MFDETNINATCKKCGVPLGEEGGNAEYCGTCMIEMAEEYVPEEQEQLPVRREKKGKAWLITQVSIIVACVAIMLSQTPRLMSALQEDQPLRYGTYRTDEQADQCIKNLWYISKLLQEGKSPGTDLVCPVSQEPYVIKHADGGVVVSCPHPEHHDLTILKVSKKQPVPEVVK